MFPRVHKPRSGRGPRWRRILTQASREHYKLWLMSRLLLALRCFFAVLFSKRLPDDAAELLPRDAKRLPASTPAQKTEPKAEPPKATEPPEPKAEPPKAPEPKAEPIGSKERDAIRQRGAVQLLALLQREGRLIDFLLEDIDGYSDGQIGAAVRDIHRGCKKGLAEHLQVVPIRPEPDEAVVKIAAGHDPSQIRLVGHVTGKPPFEGSLRHHGWRVKSCSLSDIPEGHDATVICPAEVEIAG